MHSSTGIGKPMLGSEAVVDRYHDRIGLPRQQAAERVVRFDAAEHEAAAMQVEQSRQTGLFARPIDPHPEFAMRPGQGEIDHGGDRRGIGVPIGRGCVHRRRVISSAGASTSTLRSSAGETAAARWPASTIAGSMVSTRVMAPPPKAMANCRGLQGKQRPPQPHCALCPPGKPSTVRTERDYPAGPGLGSLHREWRGKLSVEMRRLSGAAFFDSRPPCLRCPAGSANGDCRLENDRPRRPVRPGTFFSRG